MTKRGAKVMTEILGELEDAGFGSERRLHDKARAGRVLGVEYDRDAGHWRFTSEPGYLGPIPSQTQEFIAPRGTVEVCVELMSGAVSSKIYVGAIRQRGAPPAITYVPLRAETSGAMVRVQWTDDAGPQS